MNQERIFYGSAGFVVENVDKQTGEEFDSFLANEGFKSTKWIDLPSTGYVHVNIESMRYGYSRTGIKIAENNYDEIPSHPFTGNEFKTIWNVLKKHGFKQKRVESHDRKYLNSGYSCFLVKDENLENQTFWNYLEKENFKSLTENDSPAEWLLINVANSTYIYWSDNEEVISHVKDNCENSLTCDEFKVIWEVIRKHR